MMMRQKYNIAIAERDVGNASNVDVRIGNGSRLDHGDEGIEHVN